MAIKPLMTWDKGSKRWQKKFNGKSYFISPKQLGMPPMKDQSVIAANQWWEKKQTELSAQSNADPEWDRMKAAIEKAAGEKADTVQDVLRLFIDRMKAPHDPELAEAIIGVEKVQATASNVKAGMALAFGEVEESRTVAAKVKEWLQMLRSSVNVNLMSAPRWDAYKRYSNIFVNWIGGGSSVDVITAAKVEEFWAWLALKISEGRFATASARQALMTAKQFIDWLAQRGTIPMPANLRSRRLKFSEDTKKVEVVPLDHVRLMFEAANDRTKLFLLLMLNLGAYQNDVSELGEEEVNLETGIVERPRSKTPKGPVVRYRLWSETLNLLRSQAAKCKDRPVNPRGQRVVLTTDTNRLLVDYWLEGDKQKRYDTIQSAFNVIWKTLGFKHPLKCLRKTSASLLAKHTKYKYFVDYFLAHAPEKMSDRHYVIPNDDEFFEALDWLREQYGLA